MYLFQDEYDVIYENKVIPDGLSISWLMSQLDLNDITKTIEQNYYCKNLHDYFHYPVDFMIKLLIIITYRKIAYRHVKSKITEEDIAHLLPSKSPFWLPSPSNVHHFVKYRLGEEWIELLMYLIGKICPACTAIEQGFALRSAQILNLGNYPLFMIHSDGNANDKPYGEQLIDIAQMMNLKPEKVLMDGGYDSFEIHTRIFEILLCFRAIKQSLTCECWELLSLFS